MKVLLYGRLTDAIGREVELDCTGHSVTALLEQLSARHPAAEVALQRSRAFVADRLVSQEYVLGAGDVLELLPPVSGG